MIQSEPVRGIFSSIFCLFNTKQMEGITLKEPEWMEVELGL